MHYCNYLWHSVTVLCDGTVTCGPDDPHKNRDFGNINTMPVSEIFSGQRIVNLRNNLLNDKLCPGPCNLYSPISKTNPADLVQLNPCIKNLWIEPTILCNIKCQNPTCIFLYEKCQKNRTKSFLSYEAYCRLIDEIGKKLEVMHFYNYGEPFLHPKAVDMLKYLRKINPDVFIVTATNGILLDNRELAKEVVNSDINKICFTISGVNQKNYETYHKNGNLLKALNGLKNIIEFKNEMNKERPQIIWRYLIFYWNESDEEIVEAKKMATEIGVDKLEFHLTSIPIEAMSKKRRPGTKGFELIKNNVEFEFLFKSNYLPDENGFYKNEYNKTLGNFQWISKKAKLKIIKGQEIILIFSTNYYTNNTLPNVAVSLMGKIIECKVGYNEWETNIIYINNDVPEEFVTLEINVSAP